MRIKRRPSRKLVGCGIVAFGLLILISIPAFRYYRRSSGRYTPEEYPALRQRINPALVAHFPAAIPAEATGVQIRATGVDGWFPSPDYSLTVRMVLPLDRAVAISTDAAARQVPARWSDTGTAPPGSTRYVLVNPGLTTSWGGVTVNPATGEVIYWCEKF